MHAAAVGSECGAALITGKGGLGKSTTALSCLGKGLNYVGDDYVVVQLDPFARVHSLYCTAKLNWDQMARFPRFADLAKKHDHPESEKAVMYLYPEMRGQIVRSLPLKAIMTPHISDRPQTELEGISTLALQRAAASRPCRNCHMQATTLTSSSIVSLKGCEPAAGIGKQSLDTIADVIVALLSSSSSEIDCLSNRTGTEELISGPLISVIMPVHNGAQFLLESIAGVLAQKYSALEIIVVDDGSTDEIADVVHGLPVDVRFLRQHYAGLAAARNRGIREASGELVAFLDVGSLWPEGYLQNMVDVLSADSSCAIVHGFGQLMKADPEPGRYVGSPGECFPCCLSSAIFRRELFKTVGLFDQELGFGEEKEWYERARENALKVRQVNQVTLIRRHDATMNRGKSLRELKSLRILKGALERERAEARIRSEESAGGDYIGKRPVQTE